MSLKEKTPPTVTGIITTYARATSVLERAIKSMLAQTHPLAEILVVDDNPDDSPMSEAVRELCLSYDEVTYIKQDGNRGACAARNLALERAKGEFVGFLDDDDEWLPEKTEKQLKRFEEAGEDAGLVYCHGWAVIDETGERELYYNSVSSGPEISYDEILGYDYIGSTSNPLIRKSCLDTVGGFWEAQPARQDYELWIRIGRSSRLICDPEPLFLYHKHAGEQITKDRRKSYTGFKNIYQRYYEDYKKRPRAHINILNAIIRNRSGLTPEVLRYALKRQMLQLISREKRDV